MQNRVIYGGFIVIYGGPIVIYVSSMVFWLFPILSRRDICLAGVSEKIVLYLYLCASGPFFFHQSPQWQFLRSEIGKRDTFYFSICNRAN
jgi:hypothetical protein